MQLHEVRIEPENIRPVPLLVRGDLSH
jgi:hypothetical protein